MPEDMGIEPGGKSCQIWVEKYLKIGGGTWGGQGVGRGGTSAGYKDNPTKQPFSPGELILVT